MNTIVDSTSKTEYNSSRRVSGNGAFLLQPPTATYRAECPSRMDLMSRYSLDSGGKFVGGIAMGEKRICDIDGCGRLVRTRGLCRKHYKQRWCRENPEKVKQYTQKWRAANSERVTKANRAWRARNKERHWQITLRWRQENRERHLENQRRWARANKKKLRATNAFQTQKRRALKAMTFDNLSKDDAQIILSRGCFLSNLNECDGILCIAHDVALSRGGNRTTGNLFCLCRRHNSMMGTKSLPDFLQQLALFESE